jgi:uroporphyrinogen-III synthase
MRVVLTRPETDAAGWAVALQAAGHELVLLPLICIAPVADPAAIVLARNNLAAYAGVMFVSANAVNHFFSDTTGLGIAAAQTNANGRAWATGPGTVKALLEVGYPLDRIDTPPKDNAQFDSEALWEVVKGHIRSGERVLIVRGEGQTTARDWLAHQLTQAGARVEYCVAYTRELPRWSELQRQQARLCATGQAIWLFSSAEGVSNLATCLPGQSWNQARCICTHPRIARCAREAGFAVVCESRPTLADVIASIESMQ